MTVQRVASHGNDADDDDDDDDDDIPVH